MGILLASFGAVILAYIILGSLWNYSKLRQFRGPPIAGFTEFWLFWQSWKANLNIAEYEAIQKYGSVCRLGPNLLTTGDADIVRHMSAPGSAWRRSGWYEGMRLDPTIDTVFSTRDERLHADLKAKESGAYNGRDIDTLEPDLDARIADLTTLIRNSYGGKVMDLAAVTRFFTLDVLSTIAFGGHPFGFMAANDDLWDYDKLLQMFYPVMQVVCHHTLPRRILQMPGIRSVTAPKYTDKTGVGALLSVAHQAVAERYGPDAKIRDDMLGHFVRKGLSQKQCEAEAFLQVIAGSDSTTTVLRSTLWLLLGSPTAYAKLRAEVDSALSNDSVISYSQSQRLQYLQACVWEGLRMYPPLGDLKTKLAPANGDTIKGIYFPPGVEVAQNDESICRDRAVFGPDADIFRPERWTEAENDAQKRISYRQTVDTVFGTGRFQCLGRHIAMMELHKTLAHLIRTFDFQLANPLQGVEQKVYGVYVQKGMHVVARYRGEA